MKLNIALKTGDLSINLNSLNSDKNKHDLLNLTDFGSRINKKRGFLFVSKVLGKHLPVKPSIMQDNFRNLANLILKYELRNSVFIGFAETATALGHGVFEEHQKFSNNTNNNFYIHTTRYDTTSSELKNESQNIKIIEFLEEHSHAPSHILYEPNDKKLKNIFQNSENIILIDDEITTGKTTKNIILELKKVLPKSKNYIAVSILNWMNESKKSQIIEEFKNDLDLNLSFLALFNGDFSFISKDFKVEKKIISEQNQKINDINKLIPSNFGRYGVSDLFKINKTHINFDLNFSKNQNILVLGTGEFMYLPYLFSNFLETNFDINVLFHATTRSPVNVDISINSKLEFKDNYFENIDNFVYNLNENYIYDEIFICYETTKKPDFFKLKEMLTNKKFKVTELLFANNNNLVGDDIKITLLK
jgi:hypothetical protein